jgi:Arc/MetJ-type ribon-helix-helix transcriptional regulator
MKGINPCSCKCGQSSLSQSRRERRGKTIQREGILFGFKPFFLDPDKGMIYCHTMAKNKIAITIEQDLLKKLDELVEEEVYPNRSAAIQEAINDKITRIEKTRLARECAKLDKLYEQELAEEILAAEPVEWDEY